MCSLCIYCVYVFKVKYILSKISINPVTQIICTTVTIKRIVETLHMFFSGKWQYCCRAYLKERDLEDMNWGRDEDRGDQKEVAYIKTVKEHHSTWVQLEKSKQFEMQKQVSWLSRGTEKMLKKKLPIQVWASKFRSLLGRE